MSLFQKSLRLAIALVAVAFITLVGVPAKAMAAALHLPNVPVIAATDIERRTDAAARELEGYFQKENGDAVGSPADQLAGRAKQATGATQTRLEDTKDSVEDAATDAKEQGEGLVDRIK
ncbi:MAG: CsbD family protein [Microcoleus sp. SIO2G3]|nr:CsbD family protein [Microcoleus sp. SIO2G3]